METPNDHLCGLLQPCCLQKISKSVVAEILTILIAISFFSILIEIIAELMFSLYMHFFCPKQLETSKSPNSKEIEVSKSLKPSNSISNLFKKSDVISDYNFNF